MSSRLLLSMARAGQAVMLLCAPALLTAQSAAPRAPGAVRPGYAYRMTVEQETVESGRPTRREPAFITQVRTHGPVARVDFLPGTEGSNAPGDWYITRDLGRTITLVSEKTKRYREVTTVGLREQLARGKGLDVSVSGLEMTVAPDSTCARIEGWQTTCFTFRRRYDARTRYWVMSQATHVEETTRVWLAPAIRDLGTPFGTFFGSRIELLVRRDSVYIAREREVGRVLAAGGLLRMEVTHAETTGASRSQLRRVITVSNVRRAASEDLLFEVPPGYRPEKP